jgi:septum site-determining protein MinD
MNPGNVVRTIAVGGARDGVGRSIFAVNAALSFLKETRSRVLLLDLDPDGCGDLAQLLGIKATTTLADMAQNLQTLQTEHLSRQITVHPTGMGFLPMGQAPEDAVQVPAEVVARVLDLAAPLCDFIIADCGVGISSTAIPVMERSSGIFLLSSPDVLVLNHTRRLIERLQGLHFPAQLVKVILNMHEAGSQGALPLELVTQKLQRPVLVTLLRDDDAVRQSVLTSRPFVAEQPRARITRNYDEFVRKLLETGALDALARLERPQGLSIEGDRVRGLDPTSARQAQQITQWMKARGSKARRSSRKTIDPRSALKMVLHKRLVEVMDLKKMGQDLRANEEKDELLRKAAYQALVRLMDEEGRAMTDRHEREKVVKEVLDEALGLGPLEDLLADDRITEIMVNRRDQVYVEIEGKLLPVEAEFTDDAQLLGVIERIVHPLGRRVDEKSPMVDARLTDGSRVNAIIPPLAIDGPSVTIRKFARDPFVVADIIRFGSINEEMADFFRACVEARLNILISGGTGSGKTTFLNVLSSFIPSNERIVTIEDSAELQLKQPHVVRLESRPANIEGEGQVTIRDLVRNSLRMRPDRIVVGECRGAESLDMLQAMNTGHDGSLTTIHANTPRDCISRLETLVMFSGLELPSKAIREQIASAIHIIIQQARMTDGTRKVTKVAEVTGMEGNVITLQDIFVYKQTGLDENRKVIGRFVATGFVPKFIVKLEAMGIPLPRGIFAEPATAAPPRGR